METPKEDNSQKKARKISAGPIREKGRTMDKMIAAVGTVLRKEGYQALNSTNIAKAAGVDRRLVTLYFGNVDNLIALYLQRHDYWENAGKEEINSSLVHQQEVGKETIIKLLQGQYDSINQSEILQKLIHWELGEQNTTLRALSDSREEGGEPLLERLEASFPANGLDLRAILALQIGGLYYLSLHGGANGSTFCGVDISQPEGKERISKALESIVNLIYEKK